MMMISSALMISSAFIVWAVHTSSLCVYTSSSKVDSLIYVWESERGSEWEREQGREGGSVFLKLLTLACKIFIFSWQADGHDAVLEVDAVVQLNESKIKAWFNLFKSWMDDQLRNFSVMERSRLKLGDSKTQLVVIDVANPEFFSHSHLWYTLEFNI